MPILRGGFPGGVSFLASFIDSRARVSKSRLTVKGRESNWVHVYLTTRLGYIYPLYDQRV